MTIVKTTVYYIVEYANDMCQVSEQDATKMNTQDNTNGSGPGTENVGPKKTKTTEFPSGPVPPHRHRNNGLFSLPVVGAAIYALLNRPPETVAEFRAILAKHSPSDVTLLDEVLTAIPEGVPLRTVVKKVAAIKSRNYFGRMVEAPDLNGSSPASSAVILPLPPDFVDLAEQASHVFILREHHVPHHFDHLDPCFIPSKPREIREIFQATVTLAFEATFSGDGCLYTRGEIVDLLDVMEDAGMKPKLLVHFMPHHPPHEPFAPISATWEFEEI
jgi:hypothetical protein